MPHLYISHLQEDNVRILLVRKKYVCGNEGAVEAIRPLSPTPVLLPGKSHGRRSLVGYSPWGR